MRAFLGCVIAMAALSSCSKSTINNDQIIEDLYKLNGKCFYIPGGLVHLSHYGKNDWSNGIISSDTLNTIKMFAGIGLVDIQKQGELSLTERMISGIDETLYVKATEKGLKVSLGTKCYKLEKDYTKYVYYSPYDLTVSNVIEDKEVDKSVNRYRVIKGILETKMSDEGRQFYKAGNEDPLQEKANFILLIRFDDFSKEWVPVTYDWDLAASLGTRVADTLSKET